MRFLGWGVPAVVLAALLSVPGVGGCARPGADGRSAGLVVRRNGTDLDDHVILDITKRNTLKLAGRDLGVDRWVRDVTALVVNP